MTSCCTIAAGCCIRDRRHRPRPHRRWRSPNTSCPHCSPPDRPPAAVHPPFTQGDPSRHLACLRSRPTACLLYTSDAADEEDSVDLGGRRIIKQKNTKKKQHK